MKVAIINSTELGTNCWQGVRFHGGECKLVEVCKYPEKKECRAHKDKRVYSIERVYAKES